MSAPVCSLVWFVCSLLFFLLSSSLCVSDVHSPPHWCNWIIHPALCWGQSDWSNDRLSAWLLLPYSLPDWLYTSLAWMCFCFLFVFLFCLFVGCLVLFSLSFRCSRWSVSHIAIYETISDAHHCTLPVWWWWCSFTSFCILLFLPLSFFLSVSSLTLCVLVCTELLVMINVPPSPRKHTKKTLHWKKLHWNLDIARRLNSMNMCGRRKWLHLHRHRDGPSFECTTLNNKHSSSFSHIIIFLILFYHSWLLLGGLPFLFCVNSI